MLKGINNASPSPMRSSRAKRNSRSKTPKRTKFARNKSRSRSKTPQQNKEETTINKRRSIILNPKTNGYEWGGPIGALCMVFILPIIVIALNTLCSEKECAINGVYKLPLTMKETIIMAIPQLPFAIGIEVVWLLFHSILYLLPIGKRMEGMPLRNGESLIYNINAVHVFFLSHIAIGMLHYFDIFRLTILADMFVPLMIGSIIISTIISLAIYLASFRNSFVMLAEGGNTGNHFYDFWIGRELNPRSGIIDWKFMCELRPGLIGWSVLNWAFVAKSIETGTFTPSIFAISILESFYVFDALLMEEGILSMMDIVYDGFGFMLCFGDLAWVPFTYSLKTKFLAYHPVQLHPIYVLCCCLLAIVGYIIFRGSNNQKNKFRRNPRDKKISHLKVMQTSQGKSLIISGYWGVCRHPNYVGDWLMTLAWAGLTGVSALLPYYHPIYFAILLIHRQLRDEGQMREKYGEKDWKKFCGIVRYRLIPYIY